jgi:hypothetical protein
MEWEEAREMMRKYREENARCFLKIVDLWENELEPNGGKLGAEKWLVLEQVFVAALDIGRSVSQFLLFSLFLSIYSISTFSSCAPENRNIVIEKNIKFL